MSNEDNEKLQLVLRQRLLVLKVGFKASESNFENAKGEKDFKFD